MILSIVACVRALVMSVLYLPVIILMSAIEVVLNIIFKSRAVDDFMLRLWGQVSCSMFGVQVELRGGEHLPSGGCLLLFNHGSFFDIFALAAAVPGLRFGAKIELFKIPVFGYAMKRIGMLPIDRARREKVYNVYKEAESRIAQGEKFALAPEGTRQAEERLGPFKSGPFVFAINSRAPIAPVIIRGASQILPKHSLLPNWGVWSRTITLEFLPPVQACDFKIEQRGELQQQVFEQMRTAFSARQI